MSTKKLSNEIVDERLKDRTVYRIGEYINSSTKLEFGCKICDNKWHTTTESIAKSGCPKCALKIISNKFLLNNEIVDKRLEGRTIYRIGNYVSSGDKLEFGCKICGNIWKSVPATIMGKFKTGCPICNHKNKKHPNALNNEIVDERLKNRPIYRIGNYKETHEKMEFGCKVCNYKWEALPSNVLNHKKGCPNCTGRAPLTQEIIDKRLENRTIYRIGNYKNLKTSMEMGCKLCGHTWEGSVASSLYGADCPKCTSSKMEKIIHDFLIINIDEKYLTYQKKEYYNGKKFFRFDFFIKPNIIIEYHGIQHYKAVAHFGGIDQLKIQKARDKKLRKYCKEKGYSLLEIPYTMEIEEFKIKILEFLSQHVSLENPKQQSA